MAVNVFRATSSIAPRATSTRPLPRMALRLPPAPTLRPLAALAALVLLALAALGPAARSAGAQPVAFGSSDDPREALQRVWWRRASSLDLMGGLSLIAAQWRVATSAQVRYDGGPLTAQARTTLRGGIYGDYRPDLDEWYDALRQVDYVRIEPPSAPGAPQFYARFGTIRRVRLGTGHLMDFYNSNAAWDERTAGVEAFAETPYFDVGGVASDVRLARSVLGASVALRPFGALLGDEATGLRTAQVGFSAVTDRATWDAEVPALSAFAVDGRFTALQAASFRFEPFSSIAWTTRYGYGVQFGADFASEDLFDLGRFRLRLAVESSRDGFIPGYFGAFYRVNNPLARILDSQAFLSDVPDTRTVGRPLEEIEGLSRVFEVRIVIFERAELWYFYRRHFDQQNLGELHARIFFRTPGSFRFDVGTDRGGLESVLTAFNDFGDQTLFWLETEYNVAGPFWAHIRAQFTYEGLGGRPATEQRYLVQRRFEPFAGVRLSF